LGAMTNDRIIALLEEIRDLQRQHAANYQDALRNQQEAIGIQRAATRRVMRFATALMILVVVLVAVFVLPYVMR
jgi:hypothetical protein